MQRDGGRGRVTRVVLVYGKIACDAVGVAGCGLNVNNSLYAQYIHKVFSTRGTLVKTGGGWSCTLLAPSAQIYRRLAHFAHHTDHPYDATSQVGGVRDIMQIMQTS